MNPQKTVLIAESLSWKANGRWVDCPDGSTALLTEVRFPEWFEDANAAETLCDALSKEGWHCDLNNGLDRTWECEFSRPPTVETNPDDIGTRGDERLEIHYGAATTLAAAIAEAYGKCRGLWT